MQSLLRLSCLRSHRALLFLAVLWVPGAAWAHVKWFSGEFDYGDAPLAFGEIATPTFWVMAALSVVTIAAFVLLESRLESFPPYVRVERWLDEHRDRAPIVLRVATGIVLLLSWQSGVLLAHELVHGSAVVEWFQFVLILCLFHRQTTLVTGVGVGVLFGLGIAQFGLLHMLDYVAFLGVAAYLVLHSLPEGRWTPWAKPALFAATGFSLCWLSMEKLVYPQWAMVLLHENPHLTLGLDSSFFLVGAAFIEFSLGYLLIVGLLGRPLAVIITLVFFTTTLVFGKDEVIGHSILHGILVVFMLEGAGGAIRPPIRFHRTLSLRVAFATVNLLLAFAILFIPYQRMAAARSTGEAGEPSLDSFYGAHLHSGLVSVPADSAPSVQIRPRRTADGEWVLKFEVEGLRVAKDGVGGVHAQQEGHVHLYIDGKFHAQVLEPEIRIPALGEGDHVLVAELGTNDHRTYAVEGRRIRASVVVSEESGGAGPSSSPENLAIEDDDLIYFAQLPSRMDRSDRAPPKALVDLGRMLFYEPRLSKAQDISCNSCHPLDAFGVDGERTSPGHQGQRGMRNTPTVYNAGNHVAQFWDGRVETLEEQASGPILNPEEMAMDEAEVVPRLAAVPGYVSAFRKAYGSPNAEPESVITLARISEAIGAFERGLTTPGRFDRFLAGDRDALTPRERKGLKTFINLGCVTCHNGPAIGGRSMQRIGLVIPYEEDSDGGRFGVTHDPTDRRVFRVPSLRNVAETAPYFHHGRYDTLRVTVRTMARHQLGRELSEVQVELLTAFLQSLTGEIPQDYIAPPQLPE